MGLEMEELVMACEEAFGIDFRKNESELYKVETVGDLHRCIVPLLGQCQSKRCPTVSVFFSLRQEMAEALPIERSAIRPATRFLDLFPAVVWRQNWPVLEASVSYDLPMPYTVRRMSPNTVAVLAVSLFGGLILTLLLLPVLLDAGPSSPWRLWIGLSPLLLPLAAMALAVMGNRAPVEYHMPIETIGELVRRVVANGNWGYGPDGRPWNEELVWMELRDIVAERFDVDKERIGTETHFFKDLGAG